MLKPISRIFALLVFGWAGCASAAPITDTVTVNGEEWAQVDLFVYIDWNDLTAVCPGGVCNGTLKGYDMAGWSWATTDDVNTLFNHYIGFAALGPGPDWYRGAQNTFADLFFADGWRITGDFLGGSKVIDGITADVTFTRAQMTAFRDAELWCSAIPCQGLTDYDGAATNLTYEIPGPDDLAPGAWFKRTAADVPAPATLPLFGLALMILRYRRNIRAIS